MKGLTPSTIASKGSRSGSLGPGVRLFQENAYPEEIT